MEIQDKNLTCTDCGTSFVFTAGEQRFYQEKGFGHEPRRCRDCRSKKKDGGGGGGGRSSVLRGRRSRRSVIFVGRRGAPVLQRHVQRLRWSREAELPALVRSAGLLPHLLPGATARPIRQVRRAAASDEAEDLSRLVREINTSAVPQHPAPPRPHAAREDHH